MRARLTGLPQRAIGFLGRRLPTTVQHSVGARSAELSAAVTARYAGPQRFGRRTGRPHEVPTVSLRLGGLALRSQVTATTVHEVRA